ncbi:integral membrane protein S linking to the trans Golgi network-domain-containing protein [Chytriomyces sp. MP71]|nr:integral membrane protein S linking to the trans Golgi network-domain-containing protein [Chytriomyces sp. MP71]
MSSSNSFRIHHFDPIYTVIQIVCYQSSGYLGLSLVVLMVESLTGSDITLDHLLNWHDVRLDTVLGWFISFAFLINAVLCSFPLLFIVQRTRQCLDFAATFYFFHLIFTSIYSGSVPTSPIWWLLVGACIGISTAGGEYLCYQKELEPIVVNSSLTVAGMRRKTSLRGEDVEMQRLTGAGVALEVE